MTEQAKPLTPQREAFAAGLAQGLSQAAAYRKAYPRSRSWRDSAVYSSASTLAADPKVSQRVAELASKAAAANELTVERVVKEFMRLALFDARKLFDQDGRPIPIQDLDDDTAAAIIGLEVATERGREEGDSETIVRKYKVADKRAALADLGRHLKMFVDKVELSGSVALADAITAARRRAKQ